MEAAGFTTICLSNIPDLTASVSVPRIAAIEHPFGRTLGHPHDSDRQRAVLESIFQALESIHNPGQMVHLPFDWSKPPGGPEFPRAPAPPIVDYLAKHPWALPRLLKRKPPL